jgi:hypothetical protein
LPTEKEHIVQAMFQASIVDAYQRHHWESVMTPADINGVAGISWATNKFTSARNTAVAFYLRVTRGVIYISAGKAAV